MIKCICKKCGHVFMAAVILGNVKCPRCGATEDIYIRQTNNPMHGTGKPGP